MKTSCPGIRPGCFPRHSARAWATSGRSCSAAGLLLERQFQCRQRLPHRSSARGDLVRLRQPGTKLGNRCIRPLGDPGCDLVMQIRQFARHVTALRQGCPLPGLAPSPQNLGDVGAAHAPLLCDLTDGHALIGSHENALPQILRIRFATLPKHVDLPWNRRPTNHGSSSPGRPHDSSEDENALARKPCCLPDAADVAAVPV